MQTINFEVPFSSCPRCGSIEIDKDEFELFNENQGAIYCTCMACDLEWSEEYTFEGNYGKMLEANGTDETYDVINAESLNNYLQYNE